MFFMIFVFRKLKMWVGLIMKFISMLRCIGLGILFILCVVGNRRLEMRSVSLLFWVIF